MDNRIGSPPSSLPQPELTPENEVDSTASTSSASNLLPIQSESDLHGQEENLKTTGSELKSELNVSGDLIKATLNQQLEGGAGSDGAVSTEMPADVNVAAGPGGNDNVKIKKADGLLGALGLYEVNVNGKISYMTKEQLEKADFNLGGGSERVKGSQDGGKPAQPNTTRGTGGNDNVQIKKADGYLGTLGLYEVNVNGKISYMTKDQLEKANFNLGGGNDELIKTSQ